jgi:hypothetical protein
VRSNIQAEDFDLEYNDANKFIAKWDNDYFENDKKIGL